MWEPRAEFPDLSQAKIIGLDCETYDPNLKAKGPGFIRRDGHLVGISISTNNGFKAYYPIAHEDGGNLDRGNVIRYLRHELVSDTPKVGAKILYDLGWLRTVGIEVGGLKYDVQVAEPLLNENKFHYDLDSIALEHLGETKVYETLKQGLVKYNVKEDKLKENIWRMHSQYVGEYAEGDADLPIRILEKQLKLIREQELDEVFMLETELTDLLLEMKFRGVPVDIEGAHKVIKTLKDKELQSQRELNKLAGSEVDVWSNLSLAKVCESQGIKYNKTAKDNPSFAAEWLDDAAENIPMMGLVHRVRKYNRAQTFVQNSIIDASVNGRVHCDFNQVKSDTGGTGTGRFSSSGPNLQQVPARDKEMAPLIRGLFKPEPGCDWVKWDYSQQEPRLTVHYAYTRGFKMAEVARQKYIDNPETDYHQMIADLCKIERRPAKDINLGLAYGMGINKMALKLGKSKAETEEMFKTYHTNVPFIRALSDDCMNVANIRGYIKTILGRRRHFDLWDKGYGTKALPYDEAVKAYGLPVKRAFTYRAMNSVIQGGCGDMMKAAMLKLWKEYRIIPYLTVHDELDDSVEKGDKKQVVLVKHVMETIFELTVPLLTEPEIGEDWGHLKEAA